jgi:D-beta-D-heptose 7-phosphate kinase/D-beta-D-heptose 1-phosphate adenosyltransferase
MAGEFHRLAGYISAFPSVRVLCLGDVMVDRYVYGRVSRISAEAPVPIMAHHDECVMLGAVGNVARNVAALGGHATIIAVVGDDDGGRDVERLVSEQPNLSAELVVAPARQTTIKTRYVARGQQLLRADKEDTHPLGRKDKLRLIDSCREAIESHDVLVLSDYAKGCLSDEVLRETIQAARERGKPVIADPKGRSFRRYDGVDLIKPNALEVETFTGIPCTDDSAAVVSAQKVLEECSIGAVLVTRSEQGMTLVQRDGEAMHIRDRGNEVFDVSGAGDTALAALGLAVGVGAPLSDAAELANKTCNIVVSKVGTAVVHTSELMQGLQSAQFETAGAKVTSLPVLLDKVARWRAQGSCVGFTNGCFDLIHAGHVSLLDQAKEKCDRLVVGLNSDSSVRRLKGEDRPINNETARALVLASLGAVDAVVLFSEDTPMRLIEAIRPDLLVKGADYGEHQVVGAEFVKSYGGRIFLAELAPRLSTTETINRIKG